MGFVADPGAAALETIARVQIIGRMDELGGGGHIRLLPPARGVVWAVVLLDPDLAEHLNRRSITDFGRHLGRIGGLEEPEPIGPNCGGELLPFRVGFGQPVVLHSVAIAIAPGRVQVGLEPCWGGHRETIQHVAHSFPNEFQAIQRPNSGQDMGGIRALCTPCFQEVVGFEPLQQRLEEQRLGAPMDETRAEFTQYRGIKPRIGEVQGQRIFPVDPSADGIRGLAVGQAFGELQDQHQRQPCGSFGWLTSRRKERGTLGILIEGTERIANLEAQRPLGKSGMGHTNRFCGDGDYGGHLERHHIPPRATRRERPDHRRLPSIVTSQAPRCVPR